MAVRTARVVLSADVAGYISRMQAAGAATENALDRGTAKAEKQRSTLRGLGYAAGLAGTAAAAGLGLAVKTYADFDQQMSSVEAATHATTGELRLLREESIKLGADTQYTAREAAQGVEELAKAGVNTRDILGGGLKGALSLAAAGQLEVADAAEISASALVQFNLAGRDVLHVADLLAAGAGKAQGSVGDLSAALNQSGLVASQMGLSVEETIGTLSAFASAGLMGSDAGTSFRTMLLALNPKSEEAGKLMDSMSFSAYDAQGNFVGMAEVADRLRDSMAGYSTEQRTAALQTIFGQDAIRAANILYREGADGIQGWTDKVNDQGYAAETAAAKTDNLRGDVERLGGSVDSFLINLGEGGNGPLREFVQWLEVGVDNLSAWYDAEGQAKLADFGAYLRDDVLPPIVDLARELGPVVGDTLPLLATGLEAGADAAALIAPPVLAIVEAFAELPASAQQALILAAGARTLKNRMGGIGGRDGVATLAAGSLLDVGDRAEVAGGKADKSAGRFSRLKGSLRGVAGEVGLAASIASVAGAVDDLDQSLDRSSLADIADVLYGGFERGSGDRTPEFGAKLRESFDLAGLADDADRLGINLNRLADDMSRNGADGEYFAEVMGKIQTTQESALQLKTWPNPFGDSQFDSATRFEDALAGIAREWDTARTAAEAYQSQVSFFPTDPNNPQSPDRPAGGRQVDPVEVSTVKELRDLFNSLPREVQTKLTTPGAVQSKKDVIELAKQFALTPTQVETIMTALDFTGPEIDRVQARLMGMPDREIKVNADAAGALQNIDEVRAQNIRDKEFSVRAKTTSAKRSVADLVANFNSQMDRIRDEGVNVTLTPKAAQIIKAGNFLLGGTGNAGVFGANKATGGSIVGPGTGTSDDIPIMASNGEHMLTAREVQAAGGHKVIEQWRKMMLRGELSRLGDVPAFADGGAITMNARSVGMSSALSGLRAQIDSYVGDVGAYLGKRVSDGLTAMPGNGQLGIGGTLTPMQVLRGQMFVRGEAGKPYSWGGVGPSGYDCSGLISAATNAAIGSPIHRRRGATGSMPWGGFKGGLGGSLDVGWFTGSPGHTAGTLGGINIESSGGVGVRFGGPRGARDGMFNRYMHLATGGPVEYAGLRDRGGMFPSGSFVANASGRPEWVLDPEKAAHYARGGAVSQQGIGTAITMDRGDKKPTVLGSTPKITDAMRKALRDALKEFELDKDPTADEVKSEVTDLLDAIEQSFGDKSKLYLQADRLGEKLTKSSTALDKEIARRDDLAETLRELKDQRASEAATLAEGFTPDVLGDFAVYDPTDSRSLVDRLSDTLGQGTALATETDRALKAARARGLDGALYDEVAGSNNFSLQNQFANMSRTDIAQLERDYAARSAAAAAFGQTATANLGEAIRVQASTNAKVDQAVATLTNEVRGLADRLEGATERGTRQGFTERAGRENDRQRNDTSRRGL